MSFNVTRMALINASPVFFFFSRRRRHTISYGDWSSDLCSSDLQSWFISHGIERGINITVPLSIVKTVSRIAPYFGRKRVCSALYQAQQKAEEIINESPIHVSPHETSPEPNRTSAKTPPSEMTIPTRTPKLKLSRFLKTPIK